MKKSNKENNICYKKTKKRKKKKYRREREIFRVTNNNVKRNKHTSK